jgi:hypothetical protein
MSWYMACADEKNDPILFHFRKFDFALRVDVYIKVARSLRWLHKGFDMKDRAWGPRP